MEGFHVFASSMPLILSVAGTVLLIILAQIAMFLIRTGDLSFEVRRMSDLDPRRVKLQFRVENKKNKSHRFKSLRLALKREHDYFVVAHLVLAPIPQEGPYDFIATDPDGEFVLYSRKGGAAVCVLEFTLGQPLSEVYLLFDEEGKTKAARVSLSGHSWQELHFRKAKNVKDQSRKNKSLE